MAQRRKLCVVTGSRAEYGLMQRLMRLIDQDDALELQVLATGMHLSPEFGMTVRQIEADGFTVNARLEMLLSSDTAVGVTKSMGLGMIGFADEFQRLAPDVVVLLGDRFEILAAAQAAMIARIPVAHLHGGEKTEGAFDEAIRHAITKMSQWHFVAAEEYRQRVIQLGESPDRVFNVGAPGLDLLRDLDWMDREALAASLGLSLVAPLLLVTYHPATLGDRDPVDALTQLLEALEQFPQAQVVFTHPNADTGGRRLIEAIDRWVATQGERARAFASLGQRRYLSLMRLCDVVVGNSSSGLTEAPALKKATVNIGDRQKGRLKASSIIDASEDSGAIKAALARALSAEFVGQLPGTVSLYGEGEASGLIRDLLKQVSLGSQKTFFDLNHFY
ncbi:MAG: UDP-N-acetylglucosamine 2-epimerase (hydrolyzing) [Ideonella sp. MAG2]|nr:MAG: UDP-N-acetylglucosamine 2-epimerase (hydrolyzing) [Ideonella sp. MAG2]